MVYPGQSRSPELADVPAPELTPSGVRVRVVRVGVCGTDREILAGGHGVAPSGRDRLVLGHESFGQVTEVASEGSGFKPGDFVVATVRRGCAACAHCRDGMSDFCDTGGFLERGILGMDGFMAEQYVEAPPYLVRVPPELVEVGVLLEPLSVVEKAVQQALAAQIRIPARAVADVDPWRHGESSWRPERALVLGAGPIGILAALRLRLHGVSDVTIVERTHRSTKSGLLESAGVRYVASRGASLRESLGQARFDLVIEAAGAAAVVADALPLLAPNGVLCLTGIFAAGQPRLDLDLNDAFREMVYRNQAIVSSVNSNRSYFERGVVTMGLLERSWPGLLGRLITRRMPLEGFAEAVQPERDGVKTVVEMGG